MPREAIVLLTSFKYVYNKQFNLFYAMDTISFASLVFCTPEALPVW